MSGVYGGSGDEKMECGGVKAAKCDPCEVSDSRRASVLQRRASLPLILRTLSGSLSISAGVLVEKCFSNKLQQEFPDSWVILTI